MHIEKENYLKRSLYPFPFKDYLNNEEIISTFIKPKNLSEYLLPSFYSKREVSVARDLIWIDPGVELPTGMTSEDIKDALNRARDIEKQSVSFVVFVRDCLEYKGVPLAGVTHGSSGIIELSVSAARINAVIPCNLPGYLPGSAAEQLWAVTFEEALHSLRQAAGKDQDTYSVPSANPTAEDIERYLSQESEAVVDRTLNSGVLEAKFGKGTIFLGKRVLHSIFDLNYLSSLSSLKDRNIFRLFT